jgi:RES domain-containing protein
VIRTVYRVSKARYPVFDGFGAQRMGGRWNSPGHPVVYCSESMAGSLLELLVHANTPLKPPGVHHCGRAHLDPRVSVEVIEPDDLDGWDAPDEQPSRDFGDRWLAEGRTAVLVVPAATARPYGRNILLNPAHPEYPQIRIDPPVPVQWDPRLFR